MVAYALHQCRLKSTDLPTVAYPSHQCHQNQGTSMMKFLEDQNKVSWVRCVQAIIFL